jgi:hypothetical protein
LVKKIMKYIFIEYYTNSFLLTFESNNFLIFVGTY